MAEASRKKRKNSLGGSLNNQEDLDSRLLSSENDEKSGDLRKSRRNQLNDEPENRPGSLRKQALQARAKQKIAQLKAKAKELNPVYQGSKAALKFAWVNLIPSFGLTLIYINTHVFLRLIFPAFFCKLGEEWLPAQAEAGLEADSASQFIKAIKNMGEGLGLFLLDLLLLLVIIGIAFLISVLMDVIGHPINFLSALLDWVIGN